MFFASIFFAHLGGFYILSHFLKSNMALFTIFISLGLTITFFEYFMPAKPYPHKKAWPFHVLFTLIDQILIRSVIKVYFFLGLVPFFKHFIPNFHLWPQSWPLALQSILAFLLMTLGGYWSHRLMHTVPLFWQFHRLHHLPSKLTWFITFWNHPLHSFMNFTALLFFPLLLHIPQEALTYPILINIIVATLNHANIKTGRTPLNLLFPSLHEHEIHHSLNLKTANHNYGISTLLWDYVFKTYQKPEKSIEDFGIQNFEDSPRNIIKAFCWPFYTRKAIMRQIPAKSLKP